MARQIASVTRLTMIEKYQVNFKLKIIEKHKDGFIGKFDNNKKSVIKDRYALTNNIFKKDNKVDINIETIEETEIEEDIIKKKSVTFCCVINSISQNGIYTKKYDKDESIFRRAFWMDERGMITLDESLDRFEIGDVLKIRIKR
jgi:hypothetical protein